MDFDDLEDMLFGDPSSQDSAQSVLDDEDEDDLFDMWDPSTDQTEWDISEQEPSADLEACESMLLDDTEVMAVTCHLEEIKQARTIKDRVWVLSRIEEIFLRIANGLTEDGGDLSIKLKTRTTKGRRGPAVPGESNTGSSLGIRAIKFPGGTVQEAWKFTVLVRILELIHGGLSADVVLTKRDIYYRDADLFVKQSVVDRYVDDLACTFGISRSSLNVTAAAKGLVAGNFVIRRADGSAFSGQSEQEGLLVSTLHIDDVLDFSATRWVIIIEKEATFRSLLGSPQWMSLSSECLALTAKGYPDLMSRKFLRVIAERFPWIPMFVLVDFDPDGIAIMSTYKLGSCRLAHENVAAGSTQTLGLRQLRWLGVQGHQLYRTLDLERRTDSDTVDGAGILKLTARDRNKACRMLEWDVCAEDGPEPTWRRSLQMMLMLNIKAEMQILEELPGGLPLWLAGELAAMQGGEADADGNSTQVTSPSSDNGVLLL